jgi:hypothetical protein
MGHEIFSPRPFNLFSRADPKTQICVPVFKFGIINRSTDQDNSYEFSLMPK